jgi:hypothetical protein
VIFLGLAQLTGAATRLAGMLVTMGAAVLLGVVVAEGVFTLTWATAAVAGAPGSARASFDLMASFVRVFPIVPAPAVYLALGAVLLGTGPSRVRLHRSPSVSAWPSSSSASPGC